MKIEINDQQMEVKLKICFKLRKNVLFKKTELFINIQRVEMFNNLIDIRRMNFSTLSGQLHF
jgi:hypothetical protein